MEIAIIISGFLIFAGLMYIGGCITETSKTISHKLYEIQEVLRGSGE